VNKKSKVVLLTGASRGLGLAITRQLLNDGFLVIATARSKSAEFDAMLQEHAERLYFEPFDLACIGRIQEFCSSLQRRYGRFYGLVNNAGIGLDGVLATMHERDIEIVINVNLVAPMLLCKYISRGMLINRCGRIVNISSIIGSTGFAGLAVYGASKAGLHGLTKSLSRELGKAGITVNTVSPGYMETHMTSGMKVSRLESIRRRSPFDRFPSLNEVAASVGFLMSDAGSGVHGTNIVVDLGSTA
jgi:3-oxoacyl-[acyl-carrier protein] reductase